MPLPSWLRRDLALMTNRFPLSPKYRDFINSTKGVRADFLEGTTASGKTTVGAGVKFMAMVSASPKKLHIIASKTTGTAEKNILQQDNGILDLHRTARYYGGGDKDFRLPHIKFEGKIIFVLGYDNRDKWKLVLGAQFGCVYIDEINTADIDFVREISTRNDYLMATLNPDDPSLPVYKEFVNRSRPYRKYAGEVPPEILAELKEPAAPGWRYWFFTFRDNLSLSEDDISRKMEAAPKGTKLYKNKILGLRGRATGLVFSNFERQRHCISRARAKALVRQQKDRNQAEWFARFSAALDTSYSQQSPDTIAMSFIGITNLGRCILLAERVYNNAQLREPLAPSDTVREFRAFLDRNRQEWGLARTAFVDSADAATLREWDKYQRQNGSLYAVAPAWKKMTIIDRIHHQLGWLAHGDFLVVGDCENYIAELETYSWQEEKDNAPEDGHDHMINSVQYAFIPYVGEIGGQHESR